MENIKYYGPKYITNLLATIYDKDINKIKEEVNSYNITVTLEDIKTYLNESSFNTYTLEYFIKYTNILKIKILNLLDIVDKISNENTNGIKDILNDLNIKLTSKGKISSIDIKRLITYIEYNIKKLKNIVLTANNLETYLTFNITKPNKDENNLYPSENLKISDLSQNENSSISLGNKQLKKTLF